MTVMNVLRATERTLVANVFMYCILKKLNHFFPKFLESLSLSIDIMSFKRHTNIYMQKACAYDKKEIRAYDAKYT